MRQSASVLVLGDPGPVRNELLLRSEIEVLWASSIEQAEAMLKHCTVDICISSPSSGEASELCAIADMENGVPCLVLTHPNPGGANLSPMKGSTTFAVDQIETLLCELGERLDLSFAKHARADIEVPVRVVIDGEEHELRTINLSASGVAVRGFPKASAGTRAELIFEVQGRALRTQARVVRCFSSRKARAAGLVFVDLPEGVRAAIAKLVDSRLSRRSGDLSLEMLFGDLTLDIENDSSRALNTRDVDSGPLPDDFVTDMEEIEIPQLRKVLKGELELHEGAAWMQKLVSELSEVEVAAATGQKVPLWTHASFRMRCYLAWARAEERRLPSVIVDEAYRLFVGLAEEAEVHRGGMVAQIGKIRAALLRDILWLKGREQRSRFGTALAKINTADVVASSGQPENEGRVSVGVRVFQELGEFERALAE